MVKGKKVNANKENDFLLKVQQKDKNKKNHVKFSNKIRKKRTILIAQSIIIISLLIAIIIKTLGTPFIYNEDYVFLKYAKQKKVEMISDYILGKTYTFIHPLLSLPYFLANTLFQQKIVHLILIFLMITIIFFLLKHLAKSLIKEKKLIVDRYEGYILILFGLINIIPITYFFSYGNIKELYQFLFASLLSYFIIYYLIKENINILYYSIVIWILLIVLNPLLVFSLYLSLILSLLVSFLLYQLTYSLDLKKFSDLKRIYSPLKEYILVLLLILTFFILIIFKSNILIYPYSNNVTQYRPVAIKSIFSNLHIIVFFIILIVFTIFFRRFKYRMMFFIISTNALLNVIISKIIMNSYMTFIAISIFEIGIFLMFLLLMSIGEIDNSKIFNNFSIIFAIIIVILNFAFMIEKIPNFELTNQLVSEIMDKSKEIKNELENKRIYAEIYNNLFEYTIPANYLFSNYGLFIPLFSKDFSIYELIKKQRTNIDILRIIQITQLDYVITIKELNLECLTLIKSAEKMPFKVYIYNTEKCK